MKALGILATRAGKTVAIAVLRGSAVGIDAASQLEVGTSPQHVVRVLTCDAVTSENDESHGSGALFSASRESDSPALEFALDLSLDASPDSTLLERDLEGVDRVLEGELDFDTCYRLWTARDARFDGRIFVGVKSTGIFCRPICPARMPLARNCSFWRSAAAAQAAGFRPCLRCRPEAAPGTPAWRGTAASVSRALRLIEDGALDGEGSVEMLAGRLGIGSRHLRRLFDQHLGTTPGAVARLRRVLFAKQLLDETTLSMSDVALAAGFSSQRRFNACMRDVYGRTPNALRRDGRKRGGSSKSAPGAQSIRLTLPFRPPLAWDALLRFLEGRAIPGVEQVSDGSYSRVVRHRGGASVVRVRLGSDGDRLCVDVETERTTTLIDLSVRLRRLFDLDADTQAIDAVLSRASILRPHVERTAGIRVPGAVDAFETAVRAVLGQQISVKGATTIAGRIVARWGTPLSASLADGPGLAFAFPAPGALADMPLEEAGLTRARAETIRGLARAVIEAPALLEPSASLEEAAHAWQALAGIGPWTAQYVAMRVLHEPDALPASDLGLRKAISKPAEKPRPAGDVEKVLEDCRPYRAYAAIRLWDSLGGG